MVLTNDPAIAEKAGLMREYGWKERYVSFMHGWNSRLDEIQAAVLRVKLKYLDADNALRRKAAAVYDRELSSLPVTLPRERPGSYHVFHLYVVRTPKRNMLMESLKKIGIMPLIHYPVPVHLQPAYKQSAPLPATETAAGEILSLPMYPEITDAQITAVCGAVKKFFNGEL